MNQSRHDLKATPGVKFTFLFKKRRKKEKKKERKATSQLTHVAVDKGLRSKTLLTGSVVAS